jgi:hypothetical protein
VGREEFSLRENSQGKDAGDGNVKRSAYYKIALAVKRRPKRNIYSFSYQTPLPFLF